MASMRDIKSLAPGSAVFISVQDIGEASLTYTGHSYVNKNEIYNFSANGGMFSILFEENRYHSCALNGFLGRLKCLEFINVTYDEAMRPFINFSAGRWLYRISQDKVVYMAKEAIVKDKDMCRPIEYGYNVQGLIYYKEFGECIKKVICTGNIVKIVYEGFNTL